MKQLDGSFPVRARRAAAPPVIPVLALALLTAGLALLIDPPDPPRVQAFTPAAGPPDASLSRGSDSPLYRVIGWNDLGMHCMQENFANMTVLPPYNTMWAQVVRRGSPGVNPSVVTASVAVSYTIIDNTYSACDNGQATGARCKTNFWQYAPQLFPGSPAATTPGAGLSGATLAGDMRARADHFAIEGIPLVPYLDSASAFTPTHWYPYQRARIVARDAGTGQVLADTVAVAPVSAEMRCELCHARGQEPGGSTGDVEINILRLHDEENGTHLEASRPVLCASCHASNALGAPGQPDVPNLSRAMHEKHAEPIGALPAGQNGCYACHPGPVTQCLRDVMANQHGMTCESCHGGMAAVANPSRNPWVTLPRCETCHGAAFGEQPNTLYRNSTGHGGMYCEACHGSTHAIFPTSQPNDNLQNISLQGRAGTLADCRVCHGLIPQGAGPHGYIPSFAIRGRVDSLGAPLTGVNIAVTGLAMRATGLDGSYAITGLQQGVYVLTPGLDGYTFLPPSRTVSLPTGGAIPMPWDAEGQDFVAFSGLSRRVFLPLAAR